MRTKRWTREDLEFAVTSSTSIRQVLSKLGLKAAGGNYVQITRYIKEFGLDSTHFLGKGWNIEQHGIRKVPIALEDILARNSTFQSFKLKKRLFSVGIKEPRCEECGWAEKTIDGRIPVELDHINGDRTDNRLENLRILCPNCHSLKPTHRGKNKKK